MITNPAMREFKSSFMRCLLGQMAIWPQTGKWWHYDLTGQLYVFGREIYATRNPAFNAWYVFNELALGFTDIGEQNFGRIYTIEGIITDYNGAMGIS